MAERSGIHSNPNQSTRRDLLAATFPALLVRGRFTTATFDNRTQLYYSCVIKPGPHGAGGAKLPQTARNVQSRRSGASRTRKRHFTFNDSTKEEPRGETPMRKIILLFCAAACLAPAIFAQTLSQADREKGIKYLEQTRDAIVADTRNLTPAQWNFKPAPDKWSVALTLEHITLAEDSLYQLVTNKVMNSPAGAPDRDIAKTDAMVLGMVPDRSTKRQAPADLVPTGRWTPAETVDHFLQSRARTIEFLRATPDLRQHVMDSPLGPLDAYQWLLFIAAHSERHTKQILEVEASPDFPKN
jgi:DinB superfamily